MVAPWAAAPDSELMAVPVLAAPRVVTTLGMPTRALVPVAAAIPAPLSQIHVRGQRSAERLDLPLLRTH
jgi:hypothetical protein